MDAYNIEQHFFCYFFASKMVSLLFICISIWLCSIVPLASAISGTPIYVTSCNDTTQTQSWSVSGANIHSYDGQCLDIPDCDVVAGDAEIQIFPCGSTLCRGKNQMWTLNSDGSITTQMDGQCIDLNVGDGKIQTWPCTGAANQKWNIYGKNIVNNATGQCLSVAMGAPYTNPILNRDYPDPTVIKGGDGNYYAYSTQSADICVSVSANLVAWNDTTDALPNGNSWASGNYWAPDVSYHNETYYMFYAAQQTNGGNMCIGIALSKVPMGPFVDSGSPFISLHPCPFEILFDILQMCGSSFTTIDPKMFDTPDGRIFLYWGSDFGPIWVRQLDSTRMNFYPGSQQLAMVSKNFEICDSNFEAKLEPSSAPYENLIEGAWVTYNPRQSDYYFLFYSGDNCCGSNPHYAVMVARSLSPTGPFEKMGYPLLELGGQFIGTGHNSVVRDEAGEDWMFYHAFQGSDLTQRKLMMDRILYLNDWPTIGGVPGSSGSPTNSGIGPVVN